MNKIFYELKRQRFLLVFVIPLIYIFTGIYFRLILGNPSLRSIDPDYIYFISGLGISESHFKLGHIDNPGTPLQYLVALVFRLTYLLRGSPSPFVEDVFLNPDLYLEMVNFAIIAIVSITLFFTGKLIFKKTNNVLYGILLQTIPLIPAIWYQIIGRIIPELLIPIPVAILAVLLIKHLSEDQNEFKLKELILLSFVMALGLSIKLTFISFWIIPLIVVRSWKGKLSVIIFSLIFFFIIALPVTIQIERFWNWVKALFLFSGQYGSGEKNIVELSKLKENLGYIIRFDISFTYLVIFQIALILFSIFWYKNHITTQVSKKIIVSASLIATIILQAFIAGKQYTPRYFIPAVMLYPLLIYVSITLIKAFSSSSILKIGLNIILIIFLCWHINRQLVAVNIDSSSISHHIKGRKKSWHFAESLEKESIRIIVSQDYGCPFKEYALLFSTAWAENNLKPYYAGILGKLYPNTYQYTTWDDRFRYWGDEFNPDEIISNNTPVYLYLEKKSEDLLNRTLTKINPDDEYIISEKQIFLNPEIDEVFYKLKFLKRDDQDKQP